MKCSLTVLAKHFQNDLFSKKNIFCGSAENDISMSILLIGVRSCISGSPMRGNYFKVVVVVVVVISIAHKIIIDCNYVFAHEVIFVRMFINKNNDSTIYLKKNYDYYPQGRC